MIAITKQDLIDYLRKSPENLNFNIFNKMLDDYKMTYETDEQIVNKIKNIIINIIEDGGSISPEDDTITELVDLITELLPEKMIIKPAGTLKITENGEYDVINKAGVNVGVPLPSGTISITQNGTTNVNNYEYADVQVPLPSGTINITENGNINVNDYEYANVDIDNTLGTFVKNNITVFEIPEGVINIDDKVFKDYSNLEEVIIPNSVTNIGNLAFANCNNLININGGFGIQTIESDSFLNCPSTLSVYDEGQFRYTLYNNTVTIEGIKTEIPTRYGQHFPSNNTYNIIIREGVKSIGPHAFENKTMKNIVIPHSVEEIGIEAFENCKSLTSLDIPDGVTALDYEAFSNCTNLVNITIPDSVVKIGYNVFDTTPWYNNQPDGLVYAGKVAYKYKGTMPSNTSIVLEEGTKGIASKAFFGCTGLTNITIPDSVEILGSHEYDSHTFFGCTNLTSITLPSQITTIPSGCFFTCESLTDIIIPNGVTTLGDICFSSCTSLANITIPDSVVKIGEGTFNNTAWYDNQPDGLVYAGKVAYKYKGTMPSDTSITIKEGTKSFGYGTFSGCKGLTNITIPDSIIYVGKSTFSGCSGLTNIPNNILNKLNESSYGLFSGCTGLTNITIPEGVTSLAMYLFEGCTNLANITIPDSVEEIKQSVFNNTAWYNNQPNGLVYAGKVAYKYKGTMPSNTSIVLEEGTKGIASEAFEDCRNLKSITIPEGVKVIGDNAFSSCINLTEIIIPDSVEKISSFAFYSCNNLRKIVIGKNVKMIDLHAFDAPNNTEIYYTGTREEWNKIAIFDNTLCDRKIHFNYTPSN